MCFPRLGTVEREAASHTNLTQGLEFAKQLGLNSKSNVTFCNRSCYKFVDVSQTKKQRFTRKTMVVCVKCCTSVKEFVATRILKRDLRFRLRPPASTACHSWGSTAVAGAVIPAFAGATLRPGPFHLLKGNLHRHEKTHRPPHQASML